MRSVIQALFLSLSLSLSLSRARALDMFCAIDRGHHP